MMTSRFFMSIEFSIGLHRKCWQIDTTHTVVAPIETFCTCLFPVELTSNTFLNILRALLTTSGLEIRNKTLRFRQIKIFCLYKHVFEHF